MCFESTKWRGYELVTYTELVQAFLDANCKGGYYVEWVGIDNPYFSRYPDIERLASEVVDADFYHA